MDNNTNNNQYTSKTYISIPFSGNIKEGFGGSSTFSNCINQTGDIIQQPVQPAFGENQQVQEINKQTPLIRTQLYIEEKYNKSQDENERKQIVENLFNSGLAFIDAGYYEDAIQKFDDSIQKGNEYYGEGWVQQGYTYHNMAVAYSKLNNNNDFNTNRKINNIEEAAKYFQQSQRILEKYNIQQQDEYYEYYDQLFDYQGNPVQ